MEEHSLLMNVPTVARALGVSEITVRRMTKQGRLHYHRIGDRVLYSETDIQEFVHSCAVNPRKEA